MKKTNSTDKSTPYRTHGLGRIEAPVKPAKGEPKSSKIENGSDLRGGKA